MSSLHQHDGSLLRLRARLLGLFRGFSLALPVALTPQGIGYLARHIILIVLCQYAVGPENARCVQDTFGDDTLAFAKEIRQQAAILDRDRALRIHHLEGDLLVFATLHRTLFHKTSETKAGSGLYSTGHNVGGRIEEQDRVVHGVKDEPEGQSKHASGSEDQREATLFAGQPPG